MLPSIKAAQLFVSGWLAPSATWAPRLTEKQQGVRTCKRAAVVVQLLSGCALVLLLVLLLLLLLVVVVLVLLQINQFMFDDAGRRQVALEERFVLQWGIIHPYNKV
jgi:Flp pilus assembly protein TadB